MYYKEDTSKSDDDYMRTYNVMRLGDIAFEGNKSKNYAHGRFVENTIGDGIVSHVFDVFRPITEYDLLFWKYLINYEGIMGKIMVRCTKASTMMTNLVANDFLKESILVPCIAEQREIGNFFENLDNLITLHQCKYYYFQTGSLGCESDQFLLYNAAAWKQRKLSDLATMHARIGWQNLRTSEFLDEGDYMLITGTDFEDGRINYETCHYVEQGRYDQDPHIQIHDGSILITKDGTLGKVAYVQGLAMPATLNAGVFNVEIKDEDNTDRKYLFQYLKAPFLMDYVNQRATGGTIKHLNQNILVDFPVLLPSKAEQEIIGRLFEQLDTTITLHQRKCDELKDVKKYMLQNMFPQKG